VAEHVATQKYWRMQKRVFWPSFYMDNVSAESKILDPYFFLIKQMCGSGTLLAFLLFVASFVEYNSR
jgi:hypothetical protein